MGEFWWSDKAVQMLRDRYLIDGPAKMAEMLGTTKASVMLKASRLGISKSRQAKCEWTEEMDTTLRGLYPTSDKETLVCELNLPNHVIRSRARKLGLKNLIRAELSGKTRKSHNTTCNIHFFDCWSRDMAYVLGFLFADGSISSVRKSDVVVGLAASDVCILEYIKEVIESKRELYRRQSIKDGYNRQESVFLTIGSTYVVERLAELGMKPRKTYNDDPFPWVPDELMPHFVRGYFDGDGTAFIANDRYGKYCRIGFVGAMKFITGLRDALVRLVGMRETKVVEQPCKTPVGRIMWGAKEDVRKFYEYIYPAEGYPFCLERKRKVIANWLGV